MANRKSIISTNGNVNFSDIKNSQIAIGDNITQKQDLSINDIRELIDSLMKFQEHLSLLNISRDDFDGVNGDLKNAIDEAEKEKPLISRIKDKFESAIDVIKKTDGAINIVSGWEWTQKIVSLFGKAGYLIYFAGM